MTGPDVLRLITFLLGLFFIYQTALIAAPYVMRVRKRRSTPIDIHVVSVAVFAIFMVAGGMLEVTARWSEDLTWRSPVYGLAFFIGDLALFRFKRYLEKRETLLAERVARMRVINSRLRALAEHK